MHSGACHGVTPMPTYLIICSHKTVSFRRDMFVLARHCISNIWPSAWYRASKEWMNEWMNELSEEVQAEKWKTSRSQLDKVTGKEYSRVKGKHAHRENWNGPPFTFQGETGGIRENLREDNAFRPEWNRPPLVQAGGSGPSTRCNEHSSGRMQIYI